MYTENPFPYCLALSTVHTILGLLLGLFTLYLLLITCNLYTYTWRLPLKPYDYVINLAKYMPNLFFQGRWCFWEAPQVPPAPRSPCDVTELHSDALCHAPLLGKHAPVFLLIVHQLTFYPSIAPVNLIQPGDLRWRTGSLTAAAVNTQPDCLTVPL